MSRIKVLTVFGTRPEAIKMAPVIKAMAQHPGKLVCPVCVTGQHREMLDPFLKLFAIKPAYDLELMQKNQTLESLTSLMMARLGEVMDKEKPDYLMVQGDTTSAMVGSLLAFYRKVKVAHVEAGLRTGDLSNPFPEEANRALVDRISALRFAPTPGARRNLLREGVRPASISVTGNTAVDALLWACGRRRRFRHRPLRRLGAEPLVLVTLHRRESFGAPLERVFRTILEAARRRPDLRWVFPVHPNPAVRLPARRILSHPRILLTPPLDYLDFVMLRKRAHFIVTDSGGIQEEAPSLGKPVIVVREKTERPELLAGGGVLTGTSRTALLRALLRPSRPVPSGPARNPFGDGQASERIARALRRWAAARDLLP